MATVPTLSPILDAVKDILTEENAGIKGMHVKDIASIAVAKHKNMKMSEEEFARKASSALAAHVKTRNPAFSKPKGRNGARKKGMYRLKRTVLPPLPQPPAPPVNSLYSGKAGEYAAASELLFWGFNVSLMAVDQGIDLIAEKSGKFWYIQVKTSTLTNNQSFSFSIQQSVFNNSQPKNPYYIFAMREGKNTDYAVIPCNLIAHLRTSDVIGGRNLSIQITRDDKKRIYKLNGQDINTYVNNFALN